MSSLPVVDPERLVRSVRWRQLFDMDEQIQAQIARLESDVHHIHTDVADIKVDLRRTNDKIDGMRDKLEQGNRDAGTRMDGVHEKLTEKIEDVRVDLTQKIEGVRVDLTQKIDGVRTDLTEKIEGVRVNLNGVREDLTHQINGVRQDIASTKVWAMGLYFALASGLLFVMAKGFKWL
jgi:predicted  nucleic acid-binding Zn-ribbon protein